jgi:hypothetical protein
VGYSRKYGNCPSPSNQMLAYLCILFWKLHIVKYPEKYLKEISPPMRLECITVSLDNFKQYSEASCTYIQLATTNYT